MTTAPAFRPPRFHAVTPYLTLEGAERALDFLRSAFDAEVLGRSARPDGSLAHAEVLVGDSVVEVSETSSAWPARPAALHLYVEHVDATYARALEAGATSLYPTRDTPYGDREAGLVDPCGNLWFIATRTSLPSAPPA